MPLPPILQGADGHIAEIGIFISMGMINIIVLDTEAAVPMEHNDIPREHILAIKEGGHIVILEFSTPSSCIFGALYRWYSHKVLPFIGRLISRDGAAYDYLPSSVDEFPAPERFMEMLREAGFRNCKARSQSFGIAQIYTAER